MATILSQNLDVKSPNKAHATRDGVFIRSKVIDFAEMTTLKGSALAGADVIEAVPVYAGEVVKDVLLRVVTAAGAAMTAAVGDGAGTASYIAATAVNTTAGTTTGAGGAYIFSTTPTGGKFYAANDTVDLLLGGTASGTGKVEVLVTIFSPAV